MNTETVKPELEELAKNADIGNMRGRIIEAMTMLRQLKLTPFDLFEWTHILNELSVHRLAMCSGYDRTESRVEMFDVVYEAAKRKADILDSEHPNDNGFYNSVLKSFAGK